MWYKDCCFRGGDRHNFKVVYNESPNTAIGESKIRGATVDETRSLFVLKEYSHTVCLWCGKIVSFGPTLKKV